MQENIEEGKSVTFYTNVTKK